MNVLLFLATVIGLAGLALATLLSLIGRQRRRAMVFGVLGAGWGAAYGAGLLLISLTSRDAVLRPGETKYFCGFYLDCHIGVAVVGDSTVSVIAGTAARHRFHVVTLQFSNSAVQATLRPYDLRLAMVGSDGTHYPQAQYAEGLLAGPAGYAPLARDIVPGGSYTVPVVFDLPDSAAPARLFVGEGLGFDRVIEGVLIGDEDSFLHRKVLLALPPAALGMAPATVR
jgi:hypothetical protein